MIIDNIDYDVVLVSPQEIAGEFKYKVQGETQDGAVYSEGLGFFPSVTLIIEGKQNTDFIKLYKYLAIMKNGNYDVEIVLVLPGGEITHKMTPSALNITLPYYGTNDEPYWGDMTVEFTAAEEVAAW